MKVTVSVEEKKSRRFCQVGLFLFIMVSNVFPCFSSLDVHFGDGTQGECRGEILSTEWFALFIRDS